MISVEKRIPGADKNWRTVEFLQIRDWLIENVSEDDYTSGWKGQLHKSDTYVVTFKRVDDAMAYALKWT